MSLGIEKRKMIALSGSSIFNFVFWIITSVAFFLIATSVGYFISADSDGSGIPEMKTVFSGINIYRYFSFNAFIGKVIGLFAALVGGNSLLLYFLNFTLFLFSRKIKIQKIKNKRGSYNCNNDNANNFY